MISDQLGEELIVFGRTLEGDFFTDDTQRVIYATDASVYREIPVAVAWPRTVNDIRKLIDFVKHRNITLIPRGAGTSLAGQVVGNGIVVDISRYLNSVLEVNKAEKWVRVQPGVVPDELNLLLRETDLFFAPETSTSNRCVIGGMIGNNSSGLHSLIYGTTREHLISVNAILSDGSEEEFKELTEEEFDTKCTLDSLSGAIYRQIRGIFSNPLQLQEIDNEYPDKRIIRRNTGYALDELSDCRHFRSESTKKFNFCKLLAGSEGTLAFITEAKLRLTPLPPPLKVLVCVHVRNVIEAIRGNLIALSEKPSAVELMDKKILDCTRENISQRKNRFFIQGDPGAVLIIEFTGEDMEVILARVSAMEEKMRKAGVGYHFPVITGENIKKVWELRKAGLGVLSNLPGDAKPVTVIEDTSVHPEKLEEYITEFGRILDRYGLDCVYHAHISVGELHLRPVLDLKNKKDVTVFQKVAEDTARLVKKYKGSLSGEHGDGRLRGEFIPLIYSDNIINWFIEIKQTWDPFKVFNNSKIIDTPSITTSLRYISGQDNRDLDTVFDFADTGGLIRTIEKCNGSGDCRKSELMGGIMCPSFMASRDENTTTRARANILREFMIYPRSDNPFDQKEIFDILDLCLSCKGCKSECPSNVDMAKLKAEYLQHYYDINGIPFRTRLIANITMLYKIASVFPDLYNYFAGNRFTTSIIKKLTGFARQRSIPLLHSITLRKWAETHLAGLNNGLPSLAPSVYLFADEFTNYNDTSIGIKTILLLNRLGYKVLIVNHEESARTFISKGLLRKARKSAINNILIFSDLINEKIPLIGIEPSAILTFRDEYPDLVRGEVKEKALRLARNTLMIDEFLSGEIDAGRIKHDAFTDKSLKIILHGHCQQKAIASTATTIKVLSLPVNYYVEEIKSGCCGMAGSFGYEKEHYELSMKVGELILFPEIRKAGEEICIAATGTSCRQHIKDGTDRQAFHPVEILYEALKIDS